MNLRKYWDNDHQKLTGDFIPSPYGISTEKKLTPHSFVLDVGGGRGRDSIYFLQRGHKVFIVDISPYAIDQAISTAKNLGLNLEGASVNIGNEAIPLGDNTVDVAYSHLSLHYTDKETTIRGLKEILRVMRAGAKLFATVKSPEDEEDMAKILLNSDEVSPGFYKDINSSKIQNRFTLEQWRDILNQAGYVDIEVETKREKVSRKEVKKEAENKRLIVTELQAKK